MNIYEYLWNTRLTHYLFSTSVKCLWLGLLMSGLWFGCLPSGLLSGFPCCRHGQASLFDVLGGEELVGGVTLWGECVWVGVGGVSDGVVTVIGEDVFFLIKTQRKKNLLFIIQLIHYILSFYLVFDRKIWKF